MDKLSWLLVAVLLSNSGNGTETGNTNVARANRIRERLRLTDNGELNIRVRGGRIQVRGAIESTDDAQQVLEAILQETDVKEIQLTLGIGQAPIVQHHMPGIPQSGNWLDQFDRPAFDPDELPSPASVRKRQLTPSIRSNPD